MRHLARCVALGVLTVGATFVAPTTAIAAGSSHAVVNISGGNHAISFNGSTTGLGALQMVAGVQTIGYGGQGTAVCKINGVGNPAVPGQCLGEQNGGKYWSYWRAAPGVGGFSYSHSGAGGTTVTDGWVEGWVFGTGGSPPGNFCPVSTCAPDPPPPAPATAPPATVAAPGGTSAGALAPAGGSAATPATAPDGSPIATTTTTGKGKTATSSGRDDVRASGTASGTHSSGRDDGGSGTPLGIAVAAALIAGGFGVYRFRRRRTSAANGA